MVRVVAPWPTIDVGLKLQEACAGKPEQAAELKLILALKPLSAVTFRTTDPDPPRTTVICSGFAVIAKSGATVTGTGAEVDAT
jgi:hypothetical protein